MKLYFRIIYILVFLTFLNDCGDRKQILVRINFHSVPIDNFYKIIPRDEFVLFTPEEIRKKITEFANDELMLFDSHKLKIHKDKDIISKINSYSMNLLIEDYLKKTVIDSVIPENYLLRSYATLSPEFRSAHPYSKQRNRLFEAAVNSNRDVIQSAIYNLFERTVNELEIVVDDSAIADLSRFYNDNFQRLWTANNGDVYPPQVLKSFSDDNIIVTTKSRSYNLSWLQKEVELRRIDLPFGTIGIEMFSNIFRTLIVEEHLYKTSLSKKYDRSPAIVRDIGDYKKRLCLSQYKSKKIYGLIVSNDDSLNDFYMRNRQTRYLAPSKAEVCEIFIKDSVVAINILKQALRGKDFFYLAGKYTERFRNQKRPGYLGFITATQYGGIGKTAQNLRAGGVAGSLIPSGGGYSIVKSISFIPSEPKGFESVKPSVVQDFFDERYKVISDSLVTKLKEKYRFKIYFDNVLIN